MKSRKQLILLVLAFLWAFVVLAVGFRLWSVADACAQFGDLKAECVAPQGQSILRFLFIPVAITGIALWMALTPKNNDKSGS